MMNRFAAAGMVAEARTGRRVLCVSDSQRAAHESFECVAATDVVGAMRLLAVNGCERVDFEGGGWIRFVSHRSSAGRGVAADIVFVDCDAEIGAAAELYASLMPIVATSRYGEIIRA